MSAPNAAMLHVPDGVDPVGDYIAQLGRDRDHRLELEARDRERKAALDAELDERAVRLANREQIRRLRRAVARPRGVTRRPEPR